MVVTLPLRLLQPIGPSLWDEMAADATFCFLLLPLSLLAVGYCCRCCLAADPTDRCGAPRLLQLFHPFHPLHPSHPLRRAAGAASGQPPPPQI